MPPCPRTLFALSALAALWVAPDMARAQQDMPLVVTAQRVAPGQVAVSGEVTLPNACWSAGALSEGPPEGTPTPAPAPAPTPTDADALALTLLLEHSGGQMCAMSLVASPFAGQFALPDGIGFVALHLAPPDGHSLPPLPEPSPKRIPVE